MILAWTILFAQTTLNGIEKVEYMDGIKIRDVVPQSASYVAGVYAAFSERQSVAICSPSHKRELQQKNAAGALVLHVSVFL